MIQGQKGEIRILSVPAKSGELAGAAEYLLKVLRKKPQERAKVEAALKKAPLLLSRNASKENAEKLIAGLARFGVKAVFRPVPDMAASAKPAAASPDPDPVKSAKAPSPVYTEEPAETENASDESAAPSPGKIQRRFNPLRAAITALLLCGAGYLWLTGGMGEEKPAAPSPGAKSAQRGASAAPAMKASIAAGRLLAEFDKSHAPLFDRRLAEGLKEAIYEYARLFPAGSSQEKPEVSYSYEQAEPSLFIVKFSVKSKGQTHQVEAGLYTDYERMGQNIPALSNALKNALDKLEGSVIAPGDLVIRPAGALAIADKAMETLSAPAIFKALSALGKLTGPAGVDPEAFITAGDLLSWLAYIKSASETSNLPGVLCSYATANHLLATLFMDQADPKLAHGRATLWLGLGYPSAAVSAPAGAPPAGVDWTYMTAKRDLAGVENAGKVSPQRARLAAYLSARLTHERGWIGESEPKFLSIIKEDPEFLLGIEYAAAQGSVTTARLAPFYAMESAKQGLDMTYELGESAWMERDKGFTERAAALKQGKTGIEDLLKLGMETIKKTSRLRDGDRILAYGLLSRYFAEEMMDGAYLCFQAENGIYLRLEEAETYSQMIERIWPGSPASGLASLQFKRSSEGLGGALEAVKRLDFNSASQPLLAESARLSAYNPLREPSLALKTLEALRAKSDPTPAKARLLEDIYWRLGRRPISRGLIRAALLHDPWDVRLYAHAAHLPEAEGLFKEGEKLFSGSAKFFIHAGDWAQYAGKPESAITFYLRAKALTQVDAPVIRLARLHMDRRDYAAGEQVLRPYLKDADGSFGYLDAKNLLAKILISQGKTEEAYHLMKEAKESWQMDSMVNFARAAELLGEKVEAAMFYRMAAERYPAGAAPVELAFFHLRQGEKDQALGVIRDHARFNSPDFYFEKAVEHFKEAGNPGGVIDFTAEANGGPMDADRARLLISGLMKAGLHQTAAKAALPFMTAPGLEQDFAFAGLFYQASRLAKPEEAAQALEEALNALSANKAKWRYLAAWLHTRGLYDEAFTLFNRYSEANPSEASDADFLAASSWLLAGGDAGGKDVLKNKLSSPALSPWHKMAISFHLGEAPEQKLLEAGGQNGTLAEALFAAGAVRQARGELEEAEKFYVMTLETGMEKSAAYRLASYAALGEDGRILP